VTTERILAEEQTARDGISADSTVWHCVTRSPGLKSVKPGMSSHFPESRDPSYASSAMHIQNVPRKNGELSPSGYSLHPLESGTHGVTTSPTLLCPVLAWNQQNNLKLLLIVRCFGSPGAVSPATLPIGQVGTKTNEW